MLHDNPHHATAAGSSSNNGGATDYYAVPAGATTLLDLIEHKEMPYGIGEAFASLYRMNDKDTRERNLNKVLFYCQRALDAEVAGIKKPDRQLRGSGSSSKQPNSQVNQEDDT